MATWTNKTKNTSTFTNQSKNTATFSNTAKSARYEFITTDTPDFVYVGASENEVLVFSQPSVWANLIKN